MKCGAIFSTLEAPRYHENWKVKDRNNGLIPFLEDKLFLSIYESLKYRENALIEARYLTEVVINKLHNEANNGYIYVSTIINITNVCLNRFDKVASTHYQAFHPDIN